MPVLGNVLLLAAEIILRVVLRLVKRRHKQLDQLDFEEIPSRLASPTDSDDQLPGNR